MPASDFLITVVYMKASTRVYRYVSTTIAKLIEYLCMFVFFVLTSSVAPDYCMRARGLFVASTLLRVYQLNKLNEEERRRVRREVDVPSASTSHKHKIIMATERKAAARDSRRVK